MDLEALVIEQVSYDSPLAQRILRSAVDELDRRYGPSTDTQPFEPRDFEHPRGAFLVATLEGELAGGVGLRSAGELHGEIKRLWVSPDLRRRGVGASLMAGAEDAGRSLGFEVLILETGPLQPEAVALYLKQGWELVDELPVKLSDYDQAVRFLKPL
jgi:GNAT superfamily N-acetyltransferase